MGWERKIIVTCWIVGNVPPKILYQFTCDTRKCNGGGAYAKENFTSLKVVCGLKDFCRESIRSFGSCVRCFVERSRSHTIVSQCNAWRSFVMARTRGDSALRK
ncbi:hypothetical protein, unlikely [Trypanosoma congolense IL3000]|uniref:Uncharacterized protein n=1 Tax=Trypanosoma congolense (strain IL3000) TaxID=1068625 RepID=F9W9J0_TRYCI|nr:hypothetical protein, unlikely [Trypanosoma congolense IL3000]